MNRHNYIICAKTDAGEVKHGKVAVKLQPGVLHDTRSQSFKCNWAENADFLTGNGSKPLWEMGVFQEMRHNRDF